MHRLKLKAFAAMNGHHTHRVQISGFRRYRAVGAVIIQRFDAADAGGKKPSASLLSVLAAHL